MKKREPEKPPEKAAEQEKSKAVRPTLDFNKPMSLGDFNEAFNVAASPFI